MNCQHLQCAIGADLETYPASGAQEPIDDHRLFFSLGDQRRTFELFNAVITALTLVIDCYLSPDTGLDMAPIHQAGVFGNHHGHPPVIGPDVVSRFLQQFDEIIQPVRVAFLDISDAARLDQFLDVNLRDRPLIQARPLAGVG